MFRLPRPMAARVMRLDGATSPSLPRADAGTIQGAAAAAAVPVRNLRRVMVR